MEYPQMPAKMAMALPAVILVPEMPLTMTL